MKIVTPEQIELSQLNDELFIPSGAESIVQAEIDKELSRLAKVYGHAESLQAGTELAAGDLVELAMQSSNERFNRQLKIKLGRGLFAPELENLLIGTKLGDEASYDFHFKGDAVQVQVHSLSAERQIPHPIDDALISEAGQEEDKLYSGLSTVQEFKNRLRSAHLGSLIHTQVVSRAYQAAIELLARESGIQPTESEFQAHIAKTQEKFEADLSASGNDLLSSYQEYFGPEAKDLESARQILAETAKSELVRLQYAEALAKHDDLHYSEKDYERELSEYADESGIDLAEFKDKFPFELWLTGKVEENLSSRLIPELKKRAKHLNGLD
ncbi:MAG: hypothetical protein Q4P65_02335 [Eubacteriales bacterium]|nr:hypothetical protein [Eubacteriales bacterium]